MSDDLVSRLRDAHANSTQRIVGSNIFEEAADRIESLDACVVALNHACRTMESEIERLRANVTRLTANPADHRYWEGRWRDTDRELSTLRARVREDVGPFVSADLADCKDCIDNDDKHYQSQWLADALRAARQLMEEVK